MELSPSQEPFPSMAGFPIICRTAAPGPWPPPARCCKAGSVLLQDSQSTNSQQIASLKEGEKEDWSYQSTARDVDKGRRRNPSLSSRPEVEMEFPFPLSCTMGLGPLWLHEPPLCLLGSAR